MVSKCYIFDVLSTEYNVKYSSCLLTYNVSTSLLVLFICVVNKVNSEPLNTVYLIKGFKKSRQHDLYCKKVNIIYMYMHV